LKVAVVGDIDAKTLGTMLDDIFGDLPEKADLVAVADTAPVKGGLEQVVEMAVPQSVAVFGMPSIKRKDPDFMTAFVLNHILGGGGFASQLMEEVREKRGLAYSVGSSLSTLDHAAYLTASSGTRADRADETLRLMREEITRMANEGPTQEELEAAKKYVIGSYAINNLDTSAKIARVLISMQTEGLGIDYLQKREELINAVTLDDVKAVARQLLGVEPTVVVVGPAKS